MADSEDPEATAREIAEKTIERVRKLEQPSAKDLSALREAARILDEHDRRHVRRTVGRPHIETETETDSESDLLESLLAKANEPDQDDDESGPLDVEPRRTVNAVDQPPSHQKHEPTADEREQDEREQLLAEFQQIAANAPPDPRRAAYEELRAQWQAEQAAEEAHKTAPGGPKRSGVVYVSLTLPRR
jgi:hypothetical protein